LVNVGVISMLVFGNEVPLHTQSLWFEKLELALFSLIKLLLSDIQG